MASLSDQIDRLTQSTRSIRATLANTNKNSTGIFTRAVLNTHLGDLIREVEPTELGLFSLVNNHYEQDHQLHRIQFSGATPLRKRDIDPEIYAHAALKCIRQYQSIRPMPRAYDQILAILVRFNAVRDNLNTLNDNLQQTVVNDDVPLAKSRIEQEERRIKELQTRMKELAKRKENALKIQRKTSDQESLEVPSVALPSSPQEEKFWTTPVGPSRTLRFTDNLMDEFVDLGDISTTSFQGSIPMQPTPKFGQLGSFEDTALFDTPSMINLTPEQDSDRENDDDEQEDEDLKSTPAVDSPATPTMILHCDNKDEKPDNQTTETPSSRQRKIRVNVEVERIMAKIWSTMGDIVMPSSHPKSKSGSPSTSSIIVYLQQLAMQTPRPESPVVSSVSSTSLEGNLPTFQQILTAHLLMMLLSAPPHYSMSLNKVKENLAAKGKEGGGVGQSVTRVLYGCVAKRLVKIDRGGGEQIVKFDI